MLIAIRIIGKKNRLNISTFLPSIFLSNLISKVLIDILAKEKLLLKMLYFSSFLYILIKIVLAWVSARGAKEGHMLPPPCVYVY